MPLPINDVDDYIVIGDYHDSDTNDTRIYTAVRMINWEYSTISLDL